MNFEKVWAVRQSSEVQRAKGCEQRFDLNHCCRRSKDEEIARRVESWSKGAMPGAFCWALLITEFKCSHEKTHHVGRQSNIPLNDKI